MRARTARSGSAEKTVRDIRRATRRQYSAEEKIRIILEGLRNTNVPVCFTFEIPLVFGGCIKDGSLKRAGPGSGWPVHVPRGAIAPLPDTGL
jgi:hypothetical protein